MADAIKFSEQQQHLKRNLIALIADDDTLISEVTWSDLDATDDSLHKIEIHYVEVKS